MNIDDLNTSSKVARYLREQGRNIIPIIPGTKIPPKGFKLESYFNKMCDYPITDDMSIAILHGTISNTFGIDIDMKSGGGWEDAIHVVAKDIEKILSKTMVIKTPKQGCHFIVSPMGYLPPKNAKYFNKDGVEIDIKTQGGYTLLPPSIHPERQLGKYQFISETLQCDPTDWLKFEAHLAQKGFFLKEDLDDKSLRNDYNLDTLLEGKFIKGNRRRSQNSLYCKLRIRKYSEEDAVRQVYVVNKKCAEPLDEKEIIRNIKYAEAFFQNIILPSKNEYTKVDNTAISYKDPAKIDIATDILMNNYSFITPRGTDKILLYNGMIYSNYEAEAIIKEETEKLLEHCNKSNTLEVIDKIKRKTFVDLKDFDSDPNIITVINGILNIKEKILTPHTFKNISQVLLSVEYITPKYTISDENIFGDIEKNLENTLFWRTLKDSFTVNGKFRRDDFETVLEIMASPIIKRHIDERAFMFLGSGENGKSVFFSYIECMIGKNNVSNITLQDMADDKFMSANLDGVSVNIFTDLGQNELKHTGKIKAITSNEGIEVQKKHQQGFTLYPFCKLMFSCNRFPKVYDQTQGFFRRWIIVKWEHNFENDPNRIEYLKEKLMDNQAEKNLVFSCLVSIANKLNKIGKFTHSKDWKVIQREWNANADPVDDFEINYIKDSESHKTKRETYQFYKKVMLEKGETPLGMGQFSKAFEEYHDYDRMEMDIESNRRTERVWLNIDFKVSQQISLFSSEGV